ncbi:protein-tyrosine phosphatase [Phakopsora pachyrhizi]|uniref:Putative tyrosine-protein phosphatase OCA1 n=1 Tax=Phakopsora pachyrhizi TaxID=170000 RepID=A0AAV0BRR9_PHAPC|nr:protein-tyrosine phosphatase [Phakopsora pachyrhizi]
MDQLNQQNRSGSKLVPPPNFGFVETDLYRSGEPSELSFRFIGSLKLRSLLWLAPRKPSDKFEEFLKVGGVVLHDLGIRHAASLDAVTEQSVTQALNLILNPSVYPLMIMCAGGSHRTGTVVGCLRKLQGWNLASIFEEYRRYAGAQHHIMNEQCEFNFLKHFLKKRKEKKV